MSKMTPLRLARDASAGEALEEEGEEDCEGDVARGKRLQEEWEEQTETGVPERRGDQTSQILGPIAAFLFL